MVPSFHVCWRRQEWEDKAAKLDKAFDVNSAAVIVSEDVLRRARAVHDKMFGRSDQSTGGFAAGKRRADPAWSQGDRQRSWQKWNAQSSGKDKRCFKCQGWGHLASNCTRYVS